MEPIPDLRTLPDADLADLIAYLARQEKHVSCERRILQGRLDILRAERTARKRGGSLRPEQLIEVLSLGGR